MSFVLILQTLLSATLGSFTVLPLLLFFYLLNQLVRLCITLLFSYLYGPTLKLNPTGYDGMYMYEGHTHGKRNVLYLATLEGTPDLRVLRDNYQQHILAKKEYSKLCYIWVKKWGYHCLQKDSQFRIENHVKLYQNSDEIVTERELMAKVLPKLSKDFDASKPQWEDVLIPKFVYDKEPESVKSVRVLRIHHGYMDGVSNLLLLADTQSGHSLASFPWVINPLKKVTKVGVGGYINSLLFHIYCFLNLSGACVKSLLKSPKFLKGRWYVKHFSGRTLHGWTEGVDVRALNSIKEQSGVSISAVLATILSSALRKFEIKFKNEGTPTVLDEVVVGLVAALLPYPNVSLRNNHCILKCHLNTRDLTRRARLWAIHQELRRLSTLPDIYLNHLLPRLFGEMPAIFSDICTSFIAGGGIISNFPASKSKIELWGQQVQDMAGWVPLLTPAGFGCVTIRYGDKLRFCLNADEASMTQAQMDFLLATIYEEATLLAKEMTTPSNPSKGSLIGRFLVQKVDPVDPQVKVDSQEVREKEDELNNNSNSNVPPPQSILPVGVGLRKRRSISFCHRKVVRRDLNRSSREMRLNAALGKVINTMNKLKRSEIKN